MTEEGAVGGQTEEDPNTHPMAWMRDRQNSYSDEMIHFWPLLRPLTDGGGMNTRHLAHHLLSTWQWSAATHTCVLPSRPKQHGDRALATPGVDREIRKIYGRRHMPAAYNVWWRHPSDVPGRPRAREWSQR